ncbi:MAG: STAS domain-containing protein [Chloroflexi bacterium]|nr:STAS domain-containing protein [Chloroflexota bacterium]
MSVLEITSSQIQGDVSATILHLNGSLDRNTDDQFIDRARQAHEDGARYLLLDLSNVDILTSSGLHAIHTIFRTFTPQSDLDMMHQHRDKPYKSSYFKIVCPNPQTYYILNITGFVQNIFVYNNMEEAIKSFDRQ